ncbi:MAG TPA: response regulator transcription factor [Acidimicrobiales bacterium]|nr:response regulator transcription factor [Acidimicrobiales bacterium]
MTRLLLVEDDDAIADPLLEGLGREGFEVDRVGTGTAALAAPAADLVLLDLGLPDLDGREVCRRLRIVSRTPIIVVTARDDEIDQVMLLEMGADDYVVKPFRFRELVARIRAVLRRAELPTNGAGDRPARVGELIVDRRRRRAWLGERELTLAPKEFDLLALLARQPGTVCTREEILAEVWDPHWWGPTKTLDVHVGALRRKLGDPRWISTVRGVGYRLEQPLP